VSVVSARKRTTSAPKKATLKKTGAHEAKLRAGDLRVEGAEGEEAGPVVVRRQELDVGIDSLVTLDVVDDPDVLPRPRVSECSVGDRRSSVHDHDQGGHVQRENRLRWAGPPEHKDEADRQDGECCVERPWQRREQAEVADPAEVDRPERDPPEEEGDGDGGGGKRRAPVDTSPRCSAGPPVTYRRCRRARAHEVDSRCPPPETASIPAAIAWTGRDPERARTLPVT
jgi:hypothetical protein